MNIRLLRKIQKSILASPEEFDMGCFHGGPTTGCYCQTVSCIGGWADWYTSDDDRKRNIMTAPRGAGWLAQINGANALELGIIQAKRLFYLEKWPLEYHLRYIESVDAKTQAEVACARIDHFIATNGRN